MDADLSKLPLWTWYVGVMAAALEAAYGLRCLFTEARGATRRFDQAQEAALAVLATALFIKGQNE